MSTYSAYRKVISNPFSTATNQPKIPDGLVPASMGAKRNLVGELDFEQWGVWDIIISPRYDTPIFVSTAAGKGPTAATTGPPATPAAPGGPVMFHSYTMNDNHPINSAYDGVDPVKITTNESSEISKIRLVSQGTKITLTNSTDDNDGWFESFRFTPHKDQNTYATGLGVAGQKYSMLATPGAEMFGNRDITTANTFNMNLASKSNYTTGKLRNLHRYTWVNKPCVKDVEFKDLPSSMAVSTGIAQVAQDNTWASLAFQDWDYDVIWIRVHGRGIDPALAAGGCCLPTKLMFHLVQNIECVFGEQNLLHSYMTKSHSVYNQSRTTRSMSKYKKQYTSARNPRGLYQKNGRYYIEA